VVFTKARRRSEEFVGCPLARLYEVSQKRSIASLTSSDCLMFPRRYHRGQEATRPGCGDILRGALDRQKGRKPLLRWAQS